MKKHDERLNKNKVRIISLISFLAGFSQAFFLYIMSTYIKLASGSDNLGPYYLAAYFAILLILLNLHKIVKRIGKSDVFYFSLFLKILVIILLLFVSPGIAAVILVVAYIIFGNIEWVSLDMILESFSSDRMSGRIRGKFLTIMNAGVFLGPLLSSKILEEYDYYGIFLAMLFLNVAVLAIGVWSLANVNHRFDGKLIVGDVLKKVIWRKNVRRIYYLSFVLEFFYALMIMYTPIYLLEMGLSWGEIGVIFTVMLAPFMLIQYPAGALADKKTGEKEFLILAILVMAVSTAAAYYINSPGIWIWSAVLLSTRIGAALLEVMRDSYFYKRIDGHDVDLINVFRTAKATAYILGSAASVVLLLFFPLKSIFILVAVVVFSALWPAISLQDNRSEREI